MWTRPKPTIKRCIEALLIALIASGCTHDEREPHPYVVGANDVREGSERTTDGSAQTDSREAEAPRTRVVNLASVTRMAARFVWPMQHPDALAMQGGAN